MRRTPWHVGVVPIGIAFFACYLAHIVALFASLLLMPHHRQFGAVALLLAMMTPLLPVLAGYVAARLSIQRPELHGLIVSFLGAGLYALIVLGLGRRAFDDPVGLVVLVTGYVCVAGWLGAWLGRVIGARLARSRRRSALAAQSGADGP